MQGVVDSKSIGSEVLGGLVSSDVCGVGVSEDSDEVQGVVDSKSIGSEVLGELVSSEDLGIEIF